MEDTFLNRKLVIIPCQHEWTITVGGTTLCVICLEPLAEVDCSHDTTELSLTDAGFGPSGPM